MSLNSFKKHNLIVLNANVPTNKKSGLQTEAWLYGLDSRAFCPCLDTWHIGLLLEANNEIQKIWHKCTQLSVPFSLLQTPCNVDQIRTSICKKICNDIFCIVNDSPPTSETVLKGSFELAQLRSLGACSVTSRGVFAIHTWVRYYLTSWSYHFIHSSFLVGMMPND